MALSILAGAVVAPGAGRALEARVQTLNGAPIRPPAEDIPGHFVQDRAVPVRDRTVIDADPRACARIDVDGGDPKGKPGPVEWGLGFPRIGYRCDWQLVGFRTRKRCSAYTNIPFIMSHLRIRVDSDDGAKAVWYEFK